MNPQKKIRKIVIVGNLIFIILMIGFKTSVCTGDVLEILDAGNIALTGYIGEKIETSEENRLKQVDYEKLVVPFSNWDDSDNGWRGEFWGKITRSAAASYRYSQDGDLKSLLDSTVNDILSAQKDDGCISSYPPHLQALDNNTGWDIWGRKYVFLGLARYYQYVSMDEDVKQAMIAAANYLIGQVGPEGNKTTDILLTGRHGGMASSSILEPIVILYNLTHDERFLNYAQWIAGLGGSLKHNIFDEAKKGTAPKEIGNGKAYEMMSCFEGLAELYRITSNADYYDALLKLYENIRDQEIMIHGLGGLRDAVGEYWDDGKEYQTTTVNGGKGETCVTTTWFKFCSHILRLTGDSTVADQMEITMYNALIGAMRPDGKNWTHQNPTLVAGDGSNFKQEAGNQYIGEDCCRANGPMALAMIPQYAVMKNQLGPVVNFYGEGTATVDFDDGAEWELITDGEYYRIKLSGTDFYLSGEGPPEGIENGRNIHLWTWADSDLQRWKLTRDGSFYRLRCVEGGKDFSGSGDDSNIYLWEWIGSDLQRWDIRPNTPTLAGKKTIRCVDDKRYSVAEDGGDENGDNIGRGDNVYLEISGDYPQTGSIAISVSPSAPRYFTISLRIPKWSDASNTTLNVNGGGDLVVESGSYKEISRTWYPGDVINLTLDMRGRYVEAPDEKGQYGTIMRGPIVLSQDSRIVTGTVGNYFPIEDINGYVELTPVSSSDPNIWMEFIVPPDSSHLCDYASAGNDFDESKTLCVWFLKNPTEKKTIQCKNDSLYAVAEEGRDENGDNVGRSAIVDDLVEWELIADGDVFRIKLSGTDFYLSGEGPLEDVQHIENERNIHIWTWADSNLQRWRLIPDGSFYRLRCVEGGKYFTGSGEDSNIHLWEWVDHDLQRWAIAASDGNGILLPGRIEAEDYNDGGEGVGYHDSTPGNAGGAYRSDDVDIETSTDVGGGFNVGWVENGEWLAFDVHVAENGNYDLIARVAAKDTGIDTLSLHIQVDGVNETGAMTFAPTGGWQNWINVTVPGVYLSAGPHELTVFMDAPLFNLNYVDVILSDGNGILLPGRIEAEDYNDGGEGVGYHDSTPGNAGGAYRSDDVDIETSTDVGGGFNVGWVENGEWLAFDVHVAENGNYDLIARVAAKDTGIDTLSLHIQVDGVNETGAMTLAPTGGWQNWINVTVPGVYLSAGPHELTVFMDAPLFNLNYVDVILSDG